MISGLRNGYATLDPIAFQECRLQSAADRENLEKVVSGVPRRGCCSFHSRAPSPIPERLLRPLSDSDSVLSQFDPAGSTRYSSQVIQPLFRAFRTADGSPCW